MQDKSDAQLLRDYAERGCEPAFREIVTRHTDLVYSAARRQMDSAALAGDVAQSVFTDLARKARPLADKLATDSSLVGWLYRSTHFAALTQLRDDRRRLAHERLAMEQLITNSETAPDWERIRPVLDEAMADLGDEDREALLLRYFKNHDFHTVGHALGVSDDTAQKRVSRAVDRLREFFAKRGVSVGTGGLVVVISANAVQAAPVGLAATISTAAAVAGTASVATRTTMNWLNAKTIAAILVAILVGGTLTHVVLEREISRLRSDHQNLIAQQERLTKERDAATVGSNALRSENERLNRGKVELIKLRGELAQLLRQQNGLPAAAQSETNNPPDMEETEDAQILIAATFVSVPSEDLKSFGVRWTPNAPGSKSGLLTEQQFKVLNEAMQEASDVSIIGAPRVITRSGRQAQLSWQKIHQVSDNGIIDADPGIGLDVTALYSTNAATFDLLVIGDFIHIAADFSQPAARSTQVTSRTTLIPGQTLVFAQDLPNGGKLPDSTNTPAGPRSLVVFVTPKIVDARDFPKFP